MIISVNPDAFDCYLDTLSDKLHKVFFSLLFQFSFDCSLEITHGDICECCNLTLQECLATLQELEKNQCIFISGETQEDMPWPTDGAN